MLANKLISKITISLGVLLLFHASSAFGSDDIDKQNWAFMPRLSLGPALIATCKYIRLDRQY
jgi:hypothetical protein